MCHNFNFKIFSSSFQEKVHPDNLSRQPPRKATLPASRVLQGCKTSKLQGCKVATLPFFSKFEKKGGIYDILCTS